MNRLHFVVGSLAATFLSIGGRADASETVSSIAGDVTGVLGVYGTTLANVAPVIAYNENVVFPAASTIKMLILVTAYRAEERAPGSLAQRITTRRSDLIGGSDFMAMQPDGARLSVAELLVPMVTLSDNTASNYLITHFGFAAINHTAAVAGMTRTKLARHFLDYNAIVHHSDNVTTPRDMGRLLRAIASGAREGDATIADPRHCRAMIEIMLRQTDREGIPAGALRGAQVANKTGAIDGTRDDVAIVAPFGDSPYVLSVYTKELDDVSSAYRAMRRLASLMTAKTAGSDL